MLASIRRQPHQRRHAWVAVLVATGLLVLGACTGQDNSEPAGTLAGTPAADEVEPADGGTGGEPSDTGPARGTLQINGQSHELSLGESSPVCILTESGATVMDMVSDAGHELSFAGGEIWSGEVFDPADSVPWVAASHDPPPSANATVEHSTGRLMISGEWGVEDGSGQTSEISIEVICPEEITFKP